MNPHTDPVHKTNLPNHLCQHPASPKPLGSHCSGLYQFSRMLGAPCQRLAASLLGVSSFRSAITQPTLAAWSTQRAQDALCSSSSSNSTSSSSRCGSHRSYAAAGGDDYTAEVRRPHVPSTLVFGLCSARPVCTTSPQNHNFLNGDGSPLPQATHSPDTGQDRSHSVQYQTYADHLGNLLKLVQVGSQGCCDSVIGDAVASFVAVTLSLHRTLNVLSCVEGQ